MAVYRGVIEVALAVLATRSPVTWSGHGYGVKQMGCFRPKAGLRGKSEGGAEALVGVGFCRTVATIALLIFAVAVIVARATRSSLADHVMG